MAVITMSLTAPWLKLAQASRRPGGQAGGLREEEEGPPGEPAGSDSLLCTPALTHWNVPATVLPLSLEHTRISRCQDHQKNSELQYSNSSAVAPAVSCSHSEVGSSAEVNRPTNQPVVLMETGPLFPANIGLLLERGPWTM